MLLHPAICLYPQKHVLVHLGHAISLSGWITVRSNRWTAFVDDSNTLVIQNASASLLIGAGMREHIILVLKHLQWLLGMIVAGGSLLEVGLYLPLIL